MPFPVLLLFVNRECVHSVGEVTVCCHFMLKRVIGEEIDGGVSGGRFVEDAYVKAGWSLSPVMDNFVVTDGGQSQHVHGPARVCILATSPHCLFFTYVSPSLPVAAPALLIRSCLSRTSNYSPLQGQSCTS